MITKIRLPQTLIPVSIVAITMLAAVLLFPAVNSASSEPGKQAPSKQSKNHNRLINESSPYLLQHATNPIDWFPWGKEAFDKAKREDKPIFLSIGYSTCHWCHVMAHESFSDPEVAELLNKDFISSKVIYDGAIPSGNSVAVFNLLRLGHMTGKADYLTKSERIIKSFSAEVELHPAGHCQLMVALEFALNPNYEVVIVGKPQRKDTIRMLAALRKPFLPEKVVLYRPVDQNAAAELTAIAPFTLPMAAKDGRATAYVCRENACKLPITSVDQMLENLRQN